MKYDLVIFDLDGTILNTIDDLADSMNAVLKNNGFPTRTTEEIKFMVGNGIPKLVERALPSGTSEETRTKILQDFVTYYDLHKEDKTCPYSGMLETLKQFKASGVKLAVNSNKLHEASAALCEKYFPGVFDCVCGNKPEFGTKPCPDGVYYIFEQLGFNKETVKAVYVGDSDVDFKTSQNAGIDFIGCQWGFRGKQFLEEHGAKITVSKPEDLKSFIINQSL